MKKFKLNDFENCELKKNELNEAKGGLISCFGFPGGSNNNSGGLAGMWLPTPIDIIDDPIVRPVNPGTIVKL